MAGDMSIFECRLCADNPQFSPSEFAAHLRETHQMDSSAKYQKSTINHLDARDWYEWNYEWKHDGATFAIQSVRNPRHPDDAMYWGDE